MKSYLLLSLLVISLAVMLLSCTHTTDLNIILSQPEGLTIFQSAITKFDLTWIDISINEDGYKVLRKLDDSQWEIVADLPEDTEYFEDDLSHSRQTADHVYYRVYSYEGTSISDFVEAQTEIVFPAPTDLLFDMIYWFITWTDNSLGEEGFVIERSLNGNAFEEFMVNEPNLNGAIILDVEQYTDYAFRVYAFVGEFQSDYTNLIQFTTDQSHFHADFAGDPLTGGNATTVHFNDISMIYYSPVVSWDWDFGNGQTSDQKNPSVLYLGSGQYTVSLTIVTAGGSEDTMTKVNYIIIE